MAKKKQQKVEQVYFDEEKERKTPQLKVFGGSAFDAFNTLLADQALNTLCMRGLDEEQIGKRRQGMLCALMGIAPRDELEGMLAAQMLACHNAAMECYRRATNPEQTIEQGKLNYTQANRLSRTYTSLLEALNRHRGKGQQKMTVEHVHVHEGGQAIVGNVHQGGGATEKTKEQPDAKAVTHAPGTEMRCEDPQRDPVPRTGNAKR